MTALLQLNNVCIARSGFEIVNDVNLRVGAGAITVLLGSNGSGKTTLLEGISGVIPVSSGSITLGDADITTLRRQQRARRGLGHVEQGRAVFADLTTEQNLLAAARRQHFDYAFDLFPLLKARRNVAAGALSGGEQQMLVLARAIIGKPKLLLLDEISLGLAPTIIQSLMPVVRDLADSGIGILLVEQFAEVALSVGDTVSVLSRGSVVFDGSCDELRESPELLQSAYLAGHGGATDHGVGHG